MTKDKLLATLKALGKSHSPEVALQEAAAALLAHIGDPEITVTYTLEMAKHIVLVDDAVEFQIFARD